MAAISLREYVREIEKQVEGGRNEEAIAHSRHVLESFPKCVDVYRLLGKAYLENQRYGDAGDILQRLLSAVPEDFVAHVGMSIIREDEGNLDEAIWHMERAFDVQPSNSAIQDELRRLYGRRDNVEPPKIRLTRGALARMYFKGELFPQAIAELRAALNENPDRLDLQLLLAQTYAKTGQRAEAVELAGQVLRKLPFCMSANQVMIDMLIGTDQEREIQTYYQRLSQLDPYAAYVNAAAPKVENVPHQAIRLEKLDYKVSQTTTGAPSQPLWAATLGVQVAEVASDQEESLPEWLAVSPSQAAQEAELAEGASAPETPISEAQLEAQPLVEPLKVVSEGDQIPDWMRDQGWVPASEQTLAAEEAMQPTEEPGEMEAEGELAPAEIPEWLMALAPPEAISEEKPEEEVAPWLDQLLSTAPKMEEAGGDLTWQSTDTASEGLDWKNAGLVLGAAAVGAAASDREEESSAETQLPEVEAIEPGEVIEELSPTALQPGAVPEWLIESQEITSEESLQVPGEPIEEPLPDLLAEVTPTAELPGGEIAEEFPDWLVEDLEPTKEQLVETAEEVMEPAIWSAEEEGAIEEEARVDIEAEASPEWLVERETAPGEHVSKLEEELPEWLFESEAEAEKAAPAEPETEQPEGMPSWLFEAGAAEEVETTKEEWIETSKETEGMPDWLKAAGAVAGTVGAFEGLEWPGEEQEAAVELSLAAEIETSEALIDQETGGWLPQAEAPETEQPLVEVQEVDLGDTQPTRVEIPASTPVISKELDDAFAWLDSMLKPIEPKVEIAETQATIEEEVVKTPPASEEEPPPPTEIVGAKTPMDEDAAFAWLENLAVRQGAHEALLLKPEERREMPPDWVEAEVTVESVDVSLDKITEEETTQELEAEATAMEGFTGEEESSVGPTVQVSPTATIEEPPELPEWLAEPVTETPQEALEWTPPPVTHRMYDVNKITLAELERLPGVGFIVAQRVIEYRNTRGPFKKIDDLLNVPEFSTPMLEGIRANLFLETRPEPTPATEPIPTPTKPDTTPMVLVTSAGLPQEVERARKFLGEGQLGEALGMYNELIQANKHLPWVIEDLQEASNQYPGEFYVWQSLGDAYLRSDLTGQALQAFSRAEKLLLV